MAKSTTTASKVEKAAKGVVDTVTKAAKDLAGKVAGKSPSKATSSKSASSKRNAAKPQAGKAGGTTSAATKEKGLILGFWAAINDGPLAVLTSPVRLGT